MKMIKYPFTSVRKNLLLLLFFWMFASVVHSQNAWNQLYQIGEANIANDVIQATDGNFLAVCNRFTFVKVDQNGDLLLSQELGSQSSKPHVIIETQSGEFIIAGRFDSSLPAPAALMKIDNNGNILWQQTYAEGEAYDIVENTNGNFTFVSHTGSAFNISETNLTTVDNNGNILWIKTIAVENKDVSGFDIELASDGGYIILGQEKTTAENKTFVAKTDINGDLQSYNTYNIEIDPPHYQKGTSITQMDDDHFVAMVSIDPIGDRVRTTVFKGSFSSPEIDWSVFTPQASNNSTSGNGGDIVFDTDGNVVIAGIKHPNTQSGAVGGPYLQKLDSSNGEEIWFNLYGPPYVADFSLPVPLIRDLEKTSDGGFILAGGVGDVGAQVLLIKTDSLGDLPDHIIEGQITNDSNSNCTNDNEQGLPSWIVKAESDLRVYYGMTDNEGNYSISVDTGNYVLSLIPISNYWQSCTNNVPLDIVNYDEITTVDFSVQTLFDCPLMTVDIGTWFLRRCFENTYKVRYCNQGTTTAENATVVVELNPLISYISSSVPLLSQTDNSYTFDIGDVEALACGSFNIDVLVDCDSTALGQVLCSQAQIFPDSLCEGVPEDWDGSEINTMIRCDADSIQFIITNTGASDMSEALQYVIIEDQVIMLQGSYQLNSGESKSILIQAMQGSEYIINVEQSNNHPVLSNILSLGISGCNSDEVDIVFYPPAFPEGDSAPSVSIDCQELIGSYDPNDKQGFPMGYGDDNLIEQNTDIEYHIRFQNTGTDTAFKVVIVDTLSAYLDPASFKAGASSHDYSYKISGQGVIEFTFDNIMLPDSNVNLAASNGFVKFRIAQQKDNSLGTLINNEAAIYFDFNDPIITNQTIHTIGEPLINLFDNVINPELPQVSMKVYPNPFADQVTFEINGAEFDQLQLSLYDLTGKLIRKQSYENNTFQLRRQQLLTGMYIYKIEGDGQLISSGKLLVH